MALTTRPGDRSKLCLFIYMSQQARIQRKQQRRCTAGRLILVKEHTYPAARIEAAKQRACRSCQHYLHLDFLKLAL